MQSGLMSKTFRHHVHQRVVLQSLLLHKIIFADASNINKARELRSLLESGAGDEAANRNDERKSSAQE